MSKYRITESNGNYNPQVKTIFGWKSLLNPRYSMFCRSMESAKNKIACHNGTFKENVVYQDGTQRR